MELTPVADLVGQRVETTVAGGWRMYAPTEIELHSWQVQVPEQLLIEVVSAGL